MQPLDQVLSIVAIITLFIWGILLIIQGLPHNNTCRIIGDSSIQNVEYIEIVKCYPDTKDYYF